MSQRRAKGGGLVTERFAAEAQMIRFDYAAPRLCMQRAERLSFAQGDGGEAHEDRALPRAVAFTIANVVAAAYAPRFQGDPGGMSRHDRKIWAVWLEGFEEDEPYEVSVPLSHATWLLKHFTNEDLKIPQALAQWAEAVTAYLEALVAQGRARGDGQSAPSSHEEARVGAG